MSNTQQTKFFVCISNQRLYKIVNNKYITMWYKSKTSWGKCATSVQDVLCGYYVERYKLVNEMKLGEYK